MSAPAAVRAPRTPVATVDEARNGLPVEPDLTQPLPKRLLRSRLAWLTRGHARSRTRSAWSCSTGRSCPTSRCRAGCCPGLGREAVPIAAKYAAITAIPLSLLFLWADRFRPQRFWVWLMTFGWGACVATYVAAGVNTWAASHLSIIGDGDPATGARAAIFVAPFVEEAAKATVLFWLAILMRYAWVSRLSGIVLAGLSGAAFAFVENILYYGRAYRYAARTIGAVSPGAGAAPDVRAARAADVLRPPALHLDDRASGWPSRCGPSPRPSASSPRWPASAPPRCCTCPSTPRPACCPTRQQLFVLLFVAVPLVLGLVGFVVRQLFKEGRLRPDPPRRLRPGGLARAGRPAAAVPAAHPDAGPVARAVPRPGDVPGHAPAAAGRHRARLPARLDGPRPRRRRRAASANGSCSPGSGRCGRRPSSTRSAARAYPWQRLRRGAGR